MCCVYATNADKTGLASEAADAVFRLVPMSDSTLPEVLVPPDVQRIAEVPLPCYADNPKPMLIITDPSPVRWHTAQTVEPRAIARW